MTALTKHRLDRAATIEQRANASIRAVRQHRPHTRFLEAAIDVLRWTQNNARGLRLTQFEATAKTHLTSALEDAFHRFVFVADGKVMPKRSKESRSELLASATNELLPGMTHEARIERAKANRRLVRGAASLDITAVERLRYALTFFSDDTQRGTLDALVEMAHFKAAIPIVTAKPKKGTLKKVVVGVGGKSRVSQCLTKADLSERTRNPGVGSELCTYCASPSERFDAYHGFDIGYIHVVSERERSSVSLTAGKLSAEVCALHRGGGSNTARRTAVNNLDQMRCERAALSEIAGKAGTIDHRSMRIRRKIGFDRGQPVLVRKELRYMDRRWEVASPILQQFLNTLLAPLRLDVTVTESLARIEVSADGYLVGIDADGYQAILHEVCSDDEATHWRDAFATCLDYLGQYLDLHSITEEAWLTITDPVDNNAQVPLASIAMFRPEWYGPNEIIVPKVGFAYRTVPCASGIYGRFIVLQPREPLDIAPGPVIEISLLPPQWVRKMYGVPRRREPDEQSR